MNHALFPLFLALSYVLTLYYHNIGNIRPESLYTPLIAVAGAWLMLWFLFGLAFTDTTKRMIFFALTTFLFFSFRDLTSLIPAPILYGLYVSILVFSYRLINKSESLGKISYYVIIVSSFVFVIPLIQIIYYELFERSRIPVKSHTIITGDIPTDPPLGYYPDIYYIVPDSFSSTDAIKTYMGWDNRAFDAFLEEHGFYVVKKATSNYPKTYLSLASTLNMEYLDYLSVNKNSSDETLVAPLIKNNAVLLFLLERGYRFYQIGSWWWPTQFNPHAAINFNLDLQNSLGIDPFDTIIIDSTAIRPLLPKSWFSQIVTESESDKRKRTVYQFNTLQTVPELPGPKFIFAHILAPHGPNVFGPNCENITPDSLLGKNDEEGYTDQVRCISRKIEETISVILSKSEKPPVIFIHSDEGAPFLAQRLDPPDNWKDADVTLLKKKFPVLAAYYLPGVTENILYPTITPVNAFRVIINTYFGTQLPLLEDRNFINLDMDHRYEYRDVTSSVQP